MVQFGKVFIHTRIINFKRTVLPVYCLQQSAMWQLRSLRILIPGFVYLLFLFRGQYQFVYSIRQFKTASKQLINKREHSTVYRPLLGRFTRVRTYCKMDNSLETVYIDVIDRKPFSLNLLLSRSEYIRKELKTNFNFVASFNTYENKNVFENLHKRINKYFLKVG